MTLHTLLSLLAVLLAGLAAWAALRPRRELDELRRTVEESASRTRGEMQVFLASQMHPLREELRDIAVADAGGREQQLRHSAEIMAARFTELEGRIQDAFRQARLEQGSRLDAIHQQVQERLDQMRQVVDERLQTTLEQRLGESFRLVSERLELVHRGLGDMQSLAQDVGGLKRALTNVKTRGALGEAQLGGLLEQFLAPGQYEANVRVKARGGEVVEYAVKLPGTVEGETVWLPIDAKFPLEDYQRLAEALDAGDPDAAARHGKALEERLVAEARDIRNKYIEVPSTTDFALLFLPFEGLYAEALRRPGLLQKLQREQRVTLVGPTTLAAFLNSLQMGFRTLAISRRGSEVQKLLGAVRTDFQRFGDALNALDKKLDEAKSKLAEVANRSRLLSGKLAKVDGLPDGEAAAALGPEEG